MRIKSFFAASVQAAITMARREFGDGVTLITSHIASPEARQQGEYEVVFAIEEPPEQSANNEVATSIPEKRHGGELGGGAERTQYTEFQQVLLDAVQPRPRPEVQDQKLEALRCALIDLGLEPTTTSAVMTLIGKSLAIETADGVADASPEGFRNAGAAVAEQKAGCLVTMPSRRNSHLSAAELSFINSVAGSPGSHLVQTK